MDGIIATALLFGGLALGFFAIINAADYWNRRRRR